MRKYTELSFKLLFIVGKIMLTKRFVLDKTVKGIRGLRLDNRKVVCALGSRLKKNLADYFCCQ